MQIVRSMNQFKMFHWMNFRSEPKKATIKDQAINITNLFFRKFFSTGSWFVYFFALFFLVVGVVYFFIDETRKRNLLARRREIRRSHERPPQKRRPGASARNHEIYRTVMGKVKEYMEPSINQTTCVFRQTRSGTIYGQVIGGEKSSTKLEQSEQKESKESDAEVENTEPQKVIFY